MFGASGSGVFGMGVVLGFANKGKAEMRNTTREFLKLSASAKKADLAAKSMVSGYKTAGKMMLVGGGMVAAGYAMSHLGAKTQTAKANLRSLDVSLEDTEQAFNKLKQTIVGGDLAIDIRQAQEGLYNLQSAPVPKEWWVDSAKQAGIAALATRGTMQQSIEAFTNDYNIFLKSMKGTPEDITRQWADAVSSVVKNFKTMLPVLSAEVTKVSAIAQNLGFTIQETYAGTGALMSAGLGEEAGVAFKSFFMNLSKAQEVLGMKFTDARGYALPLIDIVDKLIDKFGKGQLTLANSDLLQKAFDLRGTKAAAGFMKMRDELDRGISGANEFGISLKMMNDITNTTEFSTIKLKNALIGLGDTLSDDGKTSQTFVERITGVVKAMDSFLERHKTVQKATKGLLIGGMILGGAAMIVGGMGLALRTLIKYPKQTIKAFGKINWTGIFKPAVTAWEWARNKMFGASAFKRALTFSAMKNSIMTAFKGIFNLKSIGALFTNLGRNAGSLFVSGFKATFVGEIAYLLLVKFPEMLSELRMKWMGLETVDPNRKDVGVGAQNISARPDDSALSKFSLSYWYDKWAYNAKSVTPMKSSVDLLHKPSMPTGLGFKSNAKEKASFLSDFYKTAWRELTSKGEKKPTIADTSVPSITAQIATPAPSNVSNVTNEVNIKPTIKIEGGDESKVKAQVLAAMEQFKRDAQIAVMRHGKTPATAGAW